MTCQLSNPKPAVGRGCGPRSSVPAESAPVIVTSARTESTPSEMAGFVAVSEEQGRQVHRHTAREHHVLRDEIFRCVFDSSAMALAIGDTDGTLLYANRSLADMIGLPVEQLGGVSVFRFAHPDDKNEINTVVFDGLVRARDGMAKLERRLVRPDGSIRWVAFTISFVKGSSGQGDYLLAVGEDVTERHGLDEELQRQARHDALTGVPNRRYLFEKMKMLTATVQGDDRAGLCFVDLDRFKQINDRYGHGIGDQVLCTVATRLHDNLVGDDCTLARIGGDEFVALLAPPVDDQRVAAVADRMLSVLACPITVGDLTLRVSASIGAVIATISNTDPADLLNAADRELYRAKTRGKDRWVLRILDTDFGEIPSIGQPEQMS